MRTFGDQHCGELRNGYVRLVTPPLTVDELITILSRGADVYDEPGLDLLAHSLQTAEILSLRFPDDPELICAGLVHDIADALDPGAHTDHERIGSALVAGLLGSRVASLVGGHVAAKRYLSTVEPGYEVSTRSGETLGLQGGRMSPDEIAQFEDLPEFRDLIELRRADDAGKDPSRQVRQLEHWRPLLEMVASG